MSTVAPVRVTLPVGGEFDLVRVYSWTLAASDDGTPLEIPQFADRSVQMTGALSTATSVSIQGSLNGSNWSVLTDPQGNDLNLTSIGKLEAISEAVRYVRPLVNGGDGSTAIVITMLFRR